MTNIRLLTAVALLLGCARADAALILHYTFNQNTAYYVGSGLVADVSFHGYNGTIVGQPSVVAGDSLDALFFNNPTADQTATQYVTLPDLTPALADSSFTIAIKYKSTDATGGNGALFGNDWATGNGLAWNINSYNRPAPNGLISEAGNYFLFGNFAADGTPVTTDDAWHRAVLTVDRTAQTMRFYVDGSLVSSTSGLGALHTSFANLAVGAVQNAAYGANAAVDDFQVFDTALNATQVAQITDLHPTNNNPANQIRFSTPAQAEAKRDQLVRYIWSDGLPTSTLPSVQKNIAFPASNLNGLDASLAASVDQLDADVSGMDFHAVSYLIHPKNPTNANRLVIVQQGHQDGLLGGLDSTANKALAAGYTVIAMNMPLIGWNTDNTIVVPGGELVTIDGQYYEHSHNELFAKLAGVFSDGTAFRFFLEPVVQNINYFKSVTEGAGDVTMTGVSGGGWTTHMAAAVDARITLSVPVAGSAPLYCRDQDLGGVIGDAEQDYAPLFDEMIADDGSGGGIATWLEIYALGGYGEGRQQIMVTNQYDPVCFSGTFADSFKNIVANNVAELGAGSWEYYLETGPDSGHTITDNVQYNIIFANMAAVPEPSTLVLACAAAGFLALRLGAERRRRRL